MSIRTNKYICPFPFTGPASVAAGVEYTLITKEDCFTFRQFVDQIDDFTLHIDKDEVLVWDKKVKGESMNLIKVFGTFDCKPELLYAVLQDPLYREQWDESRVEGIKLEKLDERQDVSYYAAKAPVTGVSPREFLSQRAWHETGTDEYVIFNTAVSHSSIPDSGKDKRVRATSKVTGYFIQPWTHKDGSEGCSMTYITQIDPGGWIPHFVMNHLTTKFAPKVIENMRKASKGYAAWLATVPNHTNEWAVTPSGWFDGGVVPSVASEVSKASPTSPSYSSGVESKTQALARKQWGRAGAVSPTSGNPVSKQPVVPVSARESDAAEEAALAEGTLTA